jgi:excisionase family DNA binding protein
MHDAIRELPMSEQASITPTGQIAERHDPASPPGQRWRRPYRVLEVALALDVHVSTIYRDIESGKLRAFRLGQGRGTLRIPHEAFAEYQQRLMADAVTKPAGWVA